MSKGYVKDHNGKYRLVDKRNPENKLQEPIVMVNQQQQSKLLSLEELEKLKKDINKAFDAIMSEAFH